MGIPALCLLGRLCVICFVDLEKDAQNPQDSSNPIHSPNTIWRNRDRLSFLISAHWTPTDHKSYFEIRANSAFRYHTCQQVALHFYFTGFQDNCSWTYRYGYRCAERLAPSQESIFFFIAWRCLRFGSQGKGFGADEKIVSRVIRRIRKRSVVLLRWVGWRLSDVLWDRHGESLCPAKMSKPEKRVYWNYLEHEATYIILKGGTGADVLSSELHPAPPTETEACNGKSMCNESMLEIALKTEVGFRDTCYAMRVYRENYLKYGH